MIYFDLETCLIRPGLAAPPPVCVTWCSDDSPGGKYSHSVAAVVEGFLDSGERIWAHNGNYDWGVICANFPHLLPKVFTAFRESRILDTMHFQRLGAIAGHTKQGPLGLDLVCPAHGLRAPVKDPEIRLAFGQFYGQPASDVPARFKRYAIDDAVLLRPLVARQRKKFSSVSLDDLGKFCRVRFWKHLMSVYGLRTDVRAVELLKVDAVEHVAKLSRVAVAAGFLRANPKAKTGFSSRKANIQAAVAKAYDGNPPMTKRTKQSGPNWKPSISTSGDTLKKSGDFTLTTFSDYNEWSAVMSKDLPMLRAGTSMPVHTRIGTAATLRPTSSGPNVFNFRRKAGIRECFVPRDGFCYVDADYSSVETFCLAQLCKWVLGRSESLDRINAGLDAHCLTGAALLGISYEDFYHAYNSGSLFHIEKRQFAKIPNFGKPGGMGAATLVLFALAAGLELDLAGAEELCRGWEVAWPDFNAYLKRYIRTLKRGDFYDVPLRGYGFKRAQATYCAAANTGFQQLGAEVAGRAGWALAEAQYNDRSSVMRHSRTVLHVYDSFTLEVPIGAQHEVAEELRRIMVCEGGKAVPDCRLRVDITAGDRLSKNAKRVTNSSGELQIWTP